MTYKTIVTAYHARAARLAADVEKIANEQAKEGWGLVSFSVTPSAKAILLFRAEGPAGDNAAEE